MPYFSHKVIPLAFDIFQICFGCTAAKRNLVMRHYSQQKRVLEVGCATGNIAGAFLNQQVDYTGLDIDGAAIDYARKKFRCKTSFSFVCGKLQDQSFKSNFDFIVFSGVLHHVNDETVLDILNLSCTLLAPDGVILVSDPVEPCDNDSGLVKFYRNHFERGQYMRNAGELFQLLARVSGLRLVHKGYHGLGPFPICARPIVINFAVFCLKQNLPCIPV